MSDELVDVRTPLASSRQSRVELGSDGLLHVHAGPVTLHMERSVCEELTTTLARAMLRLATTRRTPGRPPLAVVPADGPEGG